MNWEDDMEELEEIEEADYYDYENKVSSEED